MALQGRDVRGLKDHLVAIGLQAEVLLDGSPELLHFGLRRSGMPVLSLTGIWEREVGFVKVRGNHVGLIAYKVKVIGKSQLEFLDYIIDRDPTQNPEAFKAFLWETHREGFHIEVAHDWEGGTIASSLLADTQTGSDALLGLFRDAGIRPGM